MSIEKKTKIHSSKTKEKKTCGQKIYAGDIFLISCMLNCDPTDFCLQSYEFLFGSCDVCGCVYPVFWLDSNEVLELLEFGIEKAS